MKMKIPLDLQVELWLNAIVVFSAWGSLSSDQDIGVVIGGDLAPSLGGWKQISRTKILE